MSPKNPYEGNPRLIHQESIIACIMVFALLLLINFPIINLEKISIIHNTYLLPNSFKSSVTTSLKDVLFGKVTLGLATDLWNFWHTLQSLTTLSIIFHSSGLIQPAFLYAAISCSLPLWQFTSCTFLTDLNEHKSPSSSSKTRILSHPPPGRDLY